MITGSLQGISGAEGEVPDAAEMWRIIQEQQVEIERLRMLVEQGAARSEEVRGEVRLAEEAAEEALEQSEILQTQVEATALAYEEMATEGDGGALGWWDRTSIGGYGELHANFFEDADNEIDFHRFVLFVNHSFNDWITLYTELEVEHSLAGEGKEGEVEVEQAFVRLDWTNTFSTDAGLFLLPIGMINETHEPNTFYGVERNNIESRIIPSTWWEAGLKGTLRYESGFAIDAAVTSGLDMDPSGVIRGGRQKVSKAINEVPAFTGRVKYTGIPGLELGLSAYYQDDMAQSDSADIHGLLTGAHADLSRGGFRLRALYAQWDLDGTTDSAAEEQFGYYIEPSYRWNMDEVFGDIGVYFRFSEYEYFSGKLLENTLYEIGLNYWPTDNVVFKADVQDISESDQFKKKGDTSVNVGLGYQF